VTPEIAFDHHAPDFAATNATIYADLRSRCPVAHSSTYGGFWLLARYDDVVRASRDSVTFASSGDVVVPVNDVGRLLPLHADPPDLDAYRRILAPFFGPPAVKALEPFIERATDAAIDAFAARGTVELVAELAAPIPSMTTMELLGLDPAGWRTFAEPLHDASYSRPGTATNRAAQERIRAFTRDIVDAVDARIAAPRTDAISAILGATIDGRAVTRDEAIDLVRMVIFGGMDTVMAALGNVFARCANDPELWRRLRDDRGLLATAIDEFLRLDAPVQGFARVLTADATFGDVTIRRGERIFMLYASANRDEAAFGADAAALDVERFPNRHLAFGIGGHRCLGATLARAEMRIVLDRLLTRIPDLLVTPDDVTMPESVGIVYGPLAVTATFAPRPIRSTSSP
jgi:cytochrome P450